MPFGSTNAPTMFTTLVDSVLHPYLGKLVIGFLDDILTYNASKEEHIHHLQLVFELLQAYKLNAKESKCEFLKQQIHYLGHIITKNGLMMDLAKVEAIVNQPHPMNMIKLQVFLGLVNIYWKYIQDYAKLVDPMTN